MTRLSINNSEGSTIVFREHTLLRSGPNSQLVCLLKDNLRALVQSEIQRPNFGGLYSFAVSIPSKQILQFFPQVLISRGLIQFASRILDMEQLVAEEADRIPTVKNILTARGNPA